MDFYSSTYTIACDDCMSSSLPDNEKMTLPDYSLKNESTKNYSSQTYESTHPQYNLTYVEKQQLQQQHPQQQLQQQQQFLQMQDYSCYPQKSIMLIDQHQIYTTNECTSIIGQNEQNIYLDTNYAQKEQSYNLKNLQNFDYSQLAYSSQIYPADSNYQNKQRQLIQTYVSSGLINQQMEHNQYANESKQIIHHSNNGEKMGRRTGKNNYQNYMNESENCSINSVEQNISQDYEESRSSMEMPLLKSEESQHKNNNYQNNISNANKIDDQESKSENQVIISKENQQIFESNNFNNKYSFQNQNQADEFNPNLAQHHQLASENTEAMISRDFAIVDIFPEEKFITEEEAKQNKFLIEGGVMIDLNEFLNPSVKTTFSETLNQFYCIRQIQKFKKYVVGFAELKAVPSIQISDILFQLEQLNETNENQEKLIELLKGYNNYISERKQNIEGQEQQQSQQQQQISTLILDKNYQQQPNKNCEINPIAHSLTNLAQQQNSTQLLINSENNILLPSLQIDPYSSSSRFNFNMRQTNKILSQFEKYCYSFRIIRKSPASIESLQMGVSNSLIELLGLDLNESISNTLRNISEGMLPFNFTGSEPSKHSIDEIYQIITPLKEKQKYYNRKQSLQYGELIHTSGKSVKVKIQSKVFLINSYTPLSSDIKNNQNINFNEENIGDYLEIKLYSPESMQVQKISKKRKSSTRTGVIDEQECSDMDNKERCSQYMEKVKNLIDKFYSDDTLLSPELIFRKKWIIKNNKQTN